MTGSVEIGGPRRPRRTITNATVVDVEGDVEEVRAAVVVTEADDGVLRIVAAVHLDGCDSAWLFAVALPVAPDQDAVAARFGVAPAFVWLSRDRGDPCVSV